MTIRRAKMSCHIVAAALVALIPAFSVAGEVHVYLDQGAYESALVSSTVVDFEGVPWGEIISRPAGYEWDGLVAGIGMYQVDAQVQGYYGSPFLSDFVASTLYSKPVLFELPPGTNAVGGQWFHSQTNEYDGHFTLTLADDSTFQYEYVDIATGRELGVPDFCGFICADQEIVSIEFTVEREGNPAVCMADNIDFGHGTPVAHAYRDWNADAEYFAGSFDAYAILADDIQVAPGNEGKEITAVTVDLMSWHTGGSDFYLYLYDDDPATGLPGAQLAYAYLANLDYQQRATVTAELADVFVPADGFLWVGVQATTTGAGWFIADQPSQLGYSDDTAALDEGAGFSHIDFGSDTFSNMNVVLGVPAPECPADVNGDGVVNIDDLFSVLAAWGPCDACPEDINDDGVVNIDDIFAVLAEWGPCP